MKTNNTQCKAPHARPGAVSTGMQESLCRCYHDVAGVYSRNMTYDIMASDRSNRLRYAAYIWDTDSESVHNIWNDLQRSLKIVINVNLHRRNFLSETGKSKLATFTFRQK